MITINSLGIYWKFARGHEEVDGLSFYGFWENTVPRVLEDESLKKKWINSEIEYKEVKIHAEEYKVYGVDILIKKFPSPNYWLSIIEETLKWLIDNGATVAWCGAEDSSPNPRVFDPLESAGNVYACYSNITGLMCNSNLDQELEYLRDDQLKQILDLLSSAGASL
ncbi:MAG: hypothetical protein JXR03_21565 [Cyclobacteriaceae bacterium]